MAMGVYLVSRLVSTDPMQKVSNFRLDGRVSKRREREVIDRL